MSSPSEDIREQYHRKDKVSTDLKFKRGKNGLSDIFLCKADIERIDNQEKSRDSDLLRETVNGIVSTKRQQPTKRKSEPTVKKLYTQLSQYFQKTCINVSVVENASLSKMLALLCLAVSDYGFVYFHCF